MEGGGGRQRWINSDGRRPDLGWQTQYTTQCTDEVCRIVHLKPAEFC